MPRRLAAPVLSRPILVGEANPYGANPCMALWPDPPWCSGWRLCHLVLGMEPRDYLAAFGRANLLAGPRWSAAAARAAAAGLAASTGSAPLVLLGARVAAAFGVAYAPAPRACPLLSGPGVAITNADRAYVVLPHPSGRNRVWQDSQVAARCREALLRTVPGLPLGPSAGRRGAVP